MKTSDVLRKAKELIENEENWTNGCLARDCYGKVVNPLTREAVSFDSFGALIRTTHNPDYPSFRCADYLRRAMGGKLMTFDDDNPHHIVLWAWDRAIMLAEKDGY